MSDVNLIPADYIKQRSKRCTVRRFIGAFAALLLLLVAARIMLGFAVNHEKARIEKLRSGEVLMQEQQSQYDQLNARKDELQVRLDLLEQLRGGPPAREMFAVIDSAINDSVWFTKLDFSRTEDESQSNQKGRATGYFIVVQEEGAGTLPRYSGPNSANISISGMALTHSALAEFVGLLTAQPQIRAVQVQNTHSRKYLDTSVVEYEMVASMASDNRQR